MTERFLYELHKGCFRDNGVEMSIKDVLNTLNEQHEQIEDLKDTNVRCCNEYSYFHKRMMELEKENEQLKSENIKLTVDNKELKCTNNELYQENEQLKQQKSFLKIIDDYFIQYEDGELFNLHKPSDIRSLMYILNRENGYSELQCEYNDLGKGDVK